MRSSLPKVTPQLCRAVHEPPTGPGWIHEVKHDGHRTMLVVERGSARAYTRNGHDWSDRYPGTMRHCHVGLQSSMAKLLCSSRRPLRP